MIWTKQPAGLGAVATEYKAKSRWQTWRLALEVKMKLSRLLKGWFEYRKWMNMDRTCHEHEAFKRF